MKKAVKKVVKKVIRKGNGRPVRLPCEMHLSITPQMDEAVQRASAYLGTSKSAYAKDALLLRLINDRFIAPPSPPPHPEPVKAA